MTTENIETTGEQAPEYSPVELKALEMGWRPQEEYDGDVEDFVDAKEFVGRKPLYDKIAATSKQLKNISQAVEALKLHNGKVEEAGYQRALKDLKTERKQALVDGDADRFDSLDDEIKTVERQVDVIRVEQTRPLIQEEVPAHPEFQSWQNKNQWYSSVKYMRSFADELGGRLANTMSPTDVLKEVEKAVRKEFPQKFVNPNKGDAPDVNNPRNTGRSPKAESIEMSEQELSIMNKFVRQGVMTKAEYIADLKKIKGIN